jgi:hypothetical protein
LNLCSPDITVSIWNQLAADEAAPADEGAFDEELANGGDMDFLALRGNQARVSQMPGEQS